MFTEAERKVFAVRLKLLKIGQESRPTLDSISSDEWKLEVLAKDDEKPGLQLCLVRVGACDQRENWRIRHN